MNISDEALDAAAKALYVYLDEDHRGAPEPWETLADDDDNKIDAREAARVALAAAAPHLMADALRDAAEDLSAGIVYGWDSDRPYADWLRSRADEIKAAGAGE